MSDEDIAAGSRWLPEISGELGEAKVGILCVTPENQFNPWLVFEAGALSKTMRQTFVCPMLFGMTAGQLSGPIAQFQASTFERAGVLRLLQTLNAALGQEALREDELNEIFDVWWPKLEDKLTRTPPLDSPVIPPRTTDDMLQEILNLNREQLRRENIRLDHSQVRDERLAQMLLMFEQMSATIKAAQKRSKVFDAVPGKLPLSKELTPLFGGDVPLDDMLNFMREQALASRIETQQLLSEPINRECIEKSET